jgi:hypothetical protein
VQGCDLLTPQLDAVVGALTRWQGARPVPLEVVAIETGRCRGDGPFADALVAALAPERVWRLPAGAAVEDLAAAIAGAGVFLGTSLHGAITALAYGRPFVLLNLIDDAKLDGFGDLTGLDRFVLHGGAEIPGALDLALAEPAAPALVEDLQRRIDRHFDRLAELASERAAARPGVRPDRSLDADAAADHLGRLRGEVGALHGEVGVLHGELGAVQAGLARLEAELGVSQAGLARVEVELEVAGRMAGKAERELSALQATKAFRLLAPARGLYGRLRRRRFSSTG